ncbi:MAG: hypothetical protein ABR503_11345, partial [Chitinophagaceae bacterium]
MKKAISLFLAFVILCSAYANNLSVPTLFSATPTVEKPVLNAKNVKLRVGNTGKTISLMELSTINIKEFETLTNKKMKALDRVGFKLGQKKLRNKLEADGTIKSKAITKYASKMAQDGETGFHIGGFALGFLLGLIGVLIAYLINDDKKSNRVKWSWIG